MAEPDREKAVDAAEREYMMILNWDDACAAYEKELARQGFVLTQSRNEYCIKQTFVRSCVEFRNAKVAGEEERAELFRRIADDLETAYPDLLSVREGNDRG